MGFREHQRTALIAFAGTPWDGAEVECRLDVSMGAFFDYQRVASSQDIGDLESLFARFGDEVLASWNVEDDHGQLRPATGDGFKSISAPFALAILRGWAEATAGVPAPLADASSNGDARPALPEVMGVPS